MFTTQDEALFILNKIQPNFRGPHFKKFEVLQDDKGYYIGITVDKSILDFCYIPESFSDVRVVVIPEST